VVSVVADGTLWFTDPPTHPPPPEPVGRVHAMTPDATTRVLEPDGTEVDFLEIGASGVTTNCCFGGDDGRTLFVTHEVPGQILAWEGMPTPGLAAHLWPGPTAAGPASPKTGPAR
jgi:sugar lactone lactonase YvrE